MKIRFYHNYGCFLRMNSPEILKKIEARGIKTCLCCYRGEEKWIYYCGSGGIIHGIANHEPFTPWKEKKKSFLLRIKGTRMVDCGRDLEKFIEEVKRVKL